jgi:CheY-like chemotaxis protein
MKKSVLLCEDDEGIIDVARIVLEEKGYNVVALTKCTNIMDIIHKVKPNVILLDLWMPDMSGEEVAILLKNNPATKNIPIVIVSASKDIQRVASTTRVNDFLSKPFNIEDLENIVEKYTSHVS